MRGAFELVPGEGLAFESALESAEEDDAEELAVSEPLQPDVEQQEHVFPLVGAAALQRKGNRRGHEVDDQEHEEEDQQLVKTAGVGRRGMEAAVDEVAENAGGKHDVDERRHQR